MSDYSEHERRNFQLFNRGAGKHIDHRLESGLSIGPQCPAVKAEVNRSMEEIFNINPLVAEYLVLFEGRDLDL